MSAAQDQPGAQPSEEELRAAYEAEIKKIRVEHVLLEHVVTLVNLGMRRTGLAPGTESERDPDQVKLAIEAVRNLLPLLEQAAPEQIKPIRDALSQLQLAFVRIGGQPAGEGAAPPGPPASEAAGAAAGAAGGAAGESAAQQDAPPDPEAPASGQPGPAQRSGRLWVPGQ
ncbi:MAG: hypothetical protein JO179_04370 [Solirubrobacterales bacterium]|nr:hypothetical protein [Solirubrobacterales bacterium]